MDKDFDFLQNIIDICTFSSVVLLVACTLRR